MRVGAIKRRASANRSGVQCAASNDIEDRSGSRRSVTRRVTSRSRFRSTHRSGPGRARPACFRGTMCRAHLSQSPFYNRRSYANGERRWVTRDRERVGAKRRAERGNGWRRARMGRQRADDDFSRHRGKERKKKDPRTDFRIRTSRTQRPPKRVSRTRAFKGWPRGKGRKKRDTNGERWRVYARGVAQRRSESRGEFGRLPCSAYILRATVHKFVIKT